ncbi:hypothetical protein D3C77_281280 [compost metagenome]
MNQFAQCAVLAVHQRTHQRAPGAGEFVQVAAQVVAQGSAQAVGGTFNVAQPLGTTAKRLEEGWNLVDRQVFHRRTEQRNCGVGTLCWVLDCQQPLGRLQQSLACIWTTFGDRRRHLLGVQTDRGVGLAAGLGQVGASDRELLDGITGFVQGELALFGHLHQEAHGLGATEAHATEVSRVFMQDFGDLPAHLRGNLLQACSDQVEGLIAAAGQPVLHQDADHLDAFGNINAHGGRKIQGLACRAVQFLVADATQRTQRALGCCQGRTNGGNVSALPIGADTADHAAVLVGPIGGVAGLGGNERALLLHFHLWRDQGGAGQQDATACDNSSRPGADHGASSSLGLFESALGLGSLALYGGEAFEVSFLLLDGGVGLR